MFRRPRFCAILVSLIVSFLCVAMPSHAQTDVINAPKFTGADLELDIAAIRAREDFSADQKTEIIATLNKAAENLQLGRQNIAEAQRFKTEIENASQNLRDLKGDIEKAQDELEGEFDLRKQLANKNTDSEPMREEDILELEQELISTESELEAMRAEVNVHNNALANLSRRQGLAPSDLNVARTKLGDIIVSLSGLGDGVLDVKRDAERKNLRARQFYRQAQIAALEQEIPSLALRQEIVAARKTLATIRVEKLSEHVQYLQTKTGQRRLNEAGGVKNEAEAIAQDYANYHPLISDYAADNIKISQDIVELAKKGAELSQRSANIVSRQDSTKSDLRIARELVQSGNLDRLAGATLRRLSNQLLPPEYIQAQIDETQQQGVTVTQKKLITQDQLRSMPPGRTDLAAIYEKAKKLNPDLPAISEGDETAYLELYEQRRTYLNRILSMATTLNTEIFDFQSQQKVLLEDTQTLRALLDEKLLWVPSAPAINFAWPSKVVKGAIEIFSLTNLHNALQVFLEVLPRNLLMILGLMLAVFSIMRLKPIVWEDVTQRSTTIGRVKEDSIWHTPFTILAGLFIALPVPLIFTVLGLMMDSSDTADPFIKGISHGCFALSILLYITITWFVWDRDDSLFSKHFDLPTNIRCALQFNLRWFLPVMSVLIALLIISQKFSSDNIYAGFSLFIFILASLTVAIFGGRIFYRRKDIVDELFINNPTLHNFRNSIVGIIIIFPILTALIAAYGYYASAYELLYRGFITVGIFMLSYVIYGAMKRAITVAQRAIIYRQAMERRQAELKLRAEKIKAEQLGEDAPSPPPIDDEAIDVSSVTRQSLKLLNTFLILGLGLSLWMNWNGLLPALTIFDGFEIGMIDTGLLDDEGRKIIQEITLWTILQATLIFILTFIAAKNLPGFIEIFVLSRIGVDSGIRYAVKTVSGYVIIAFGVIWGFHKLGLQWSQLRWVVPNTNVIDGSSKSLTRFVSRIEAVLFLTKNKLTISCVECCPCTQCCAGINKFAINVNRPVTTGSVPCHCQ